MNEGTEQQATQEQNDPLTLEDRTFIAHAIKNDLDNVINQKYPKDFYKKLLEHLLEQNNTNENIHNLVFARELFLSDLKIDYLLKNQSFITFLKEN